MCGIAGFVLLDQTAERARVQAMCGQIVHRGPDDEGVYVDRGCGIGMRRLSIIDLSTGHQPMSNEDGTVWIVFNGEIYEYKELRADLMARGHRFQTASDTETLIHLYEEEGVEGLKRLRGMFSFAIWDARRERLMLARDRFGKKPLYYAVLPGGIYFGSELSCLREAGVPLEPDAEALRLYFQFSYIPDPLSGFRAIRRLQAGTWLTYERGEVRQGRYWTQPTPSAQAAPGMTHAETAAKVREKFDESVRIRMIADVPLGAFLSGGIDSGSVVASMALQSPEPIKTFSIGFEESAFNELPYAKMVAEKYKTEHHEIVVRPDSIDIIRKFARHFGEPFADSSAIPTYIVSEFAARYVKVALSGDGGDELFGGYTSLQKVKRLARLDGVPQIARLAMSWASSRMPYSAYGKNFLHMLGRRSGLDRYFAFNYAPFHMRSKLLRPDWMLPAESGFLAQALPDCVLPDDAGTLSQVMYFEATANLIGDMLVKVDRMSMAASLEVRCPLLDHELAELAATIPHAWKVVDGQGKKILLDAVGDRLPAGVLNRPKMGFGVPLVDWFRTSLREVLWDSLTSEKFMARGFVSPEFLRTLLEEHDAGRRDNSRWLFTLLVLALWFEDIEQGVPAVVGVG
ncbi:MAG: asparagine synthase (glutamine-hydrolyzing) [Candidatus Solibacter sp.]|jgi:asparagine synthase (glutamine-hydrolysing)|nr:asparagine synthase (glutamine-hydrolyzing) [Candidatus Solibacter sp.]